MTNEDLVLLKKVAEDDTDTQWIGVEHGVICSLRELVIIAVTPRMALQMAVEILDARAGRESVPAEGAEEG